MNRRRQRRSAGDAPRLVMLVMPGDPDSAAPGSGTVEMLRINAAACRENGAETVAVVPDNERLRNDLEPWVDHVVSVPASGSLRRFGRLLIPMVKLIRAHRPDIVHYHVPDYRWGLDGVLASVASRRTGCLRTEHNPALVDPRWFEWPLARLTDLAVDRHVYVSEGNRRRFEHHLPWRTNGFVNVNTIDPARLIETNQGESLREACGISESELLAIFVAGSWHLDEGRRPIRPIIDAMAQVDVRWHLAFLGTGDQDVVREYAEEVGVSGRLHFLGQRSNAAELTGGADLLVAASHFEGCSIAMLEAWHHSTPIVSTAVDGIEDFTGAERVGGITVDHGDITGFAERWRAADDASSAMRETNELAVNRLATEHSLDAHKRRTWELYRDL